MGELIHFPKKFDRQLTVKDLAEELGCSIRKVRYLHAEGMPSVGIGYDGKRRYQLSEVQDWLRRREVS